VWTHLGILACLTTLAIAPAAAQAPSSDAGLRVQRQPYDILAFGAFRMLILQGDFTPKVVIKDAMAGHPTTGLGALAGARGEITIYDGRLIVSYGKEALPNPPAESEAAALLATATSPAWQTIMVDHDVAPDDIDAFLSQMAGAHGLNPEGPFPFQIRGTLASYVMHVNVTPTNGPHGMGQPIAITRESKGDAIAGMVAGIYASSDLVGIVSHGGTRTHSHWLASDLSATAHLDRWGLKAGAVLSLPKP
jgi:hypothetical protein